MKEETLENQNKERHIARLEKRLTKDKVRLDKWKKEVALNGIPQVSKKNSEIILSYLRDMELGINVSSKSCKGIRSQRRLNDIKDRMIVFSKWFDKYYGVKDLSKLTEQHVFGLFNDIRGGAIKTQSGETYKSIETIASAFKAFWHWHTKVSRKANITIEDITQDLDARGEKPDWVYLDEVQVRQLADSASFEYKVLIMFLMDTGLRPPQELLPIKVSDLNSDCTELNIRICKKNSFPRKIKLLLCPDLLKSYIKLKNKKPEDYLFEICPEVVNRNLKKYTVKLFGEGVSLAGDKYSQITMYDFRHNACCYWLPRYKSESALKYRFGWKKSEKIHYYSELLGMKDTITKEDLLIDVTKTELENRIGTIERENAFLKEQIAGFNKYWKIIDELSRKMEIKVVPLFAK